jgi:hypothetical protein
MLETKTIALSDWISSGIEWCKNERESLGRTSRDSGPVSDVDKIKTLLLAKREAYQAPEGFLVGPRITGWMYEAYCRQIGREEATRLLCDVPDCDRFSWFMQRLEDKAIKALIKGLEGSKMREYCAPRGGPLALDDSQEP